MSSPKKCAANSCVPVSITNKDGKFTHKACLICKSTIEQTSSFPSSPPAPSSPPVNLAPKVRCIDQCVPAKIGTEGGYRTVCIVCGHLTSSEVTTSAPSSPPMHTSQPPPLNVSQKPRCTVQCVPAQIGTEGGYRTVCMVCGHLTYNEQASGPPARSASPPAYSAPPTLNVSQKARCIGPCVPAKIGHGGGYRTVCIVCGNPTST